MVEVSPKYIVCNLTEHVLYFCQAHIPMGNTNSTILNCLELHHKDRIPFHWTEKDSPKNVKFFIKDAQRESAHFTLHDGGSLAVTNIDSSGTM